MITISKSAPEGNAFNIMGQVKSVLRQTDQGDRIDDVMKKMMAGDYDALCKTAEEETFGLIEIVE